MEPEELLVNKQGTLFNGENFFPVRQSPGGWLAGWLAGERPSDNDVSIHPDSLSFGVTSWQWAEPITTSISSSMFDAPA